MARNKRIINQKDHVLLVHSNVINDYPELEKILSENSKVTHEIAEEQYKGLFGMINDKMLNRITTQAASEWKGEAKDLEVIEHRKDWKRCSLCNQPNKFIFYITNELNSKSLNVGSDCIKQFGIKIDDGELSVSELIKNAERLLRISRLNNEIPRIAQIVENWNNDIEMYPILIPSKYEIPYKELGKVIRKYYDDFINGKAVEAVTVETIKENISAKDTLVQDIEEHVTKQRNNRFVPTRQLVNWLKRDKKFDVIDMLKEDELIGWKTLHRIEEPKLMNSLIADYNKKLKEIQTEIVDTDDDKKCFVLTVKTERIKLLNRFNKFNLSFGWIIFNDEPIGDFKIDTVLIDSNVYDEITLVYLIDILKDKLIRTEINIIDFNYDFNELLVHEKKINRYMIINLKQFVEEFKHIGILDINPGDSIESYLNTNNFKKYSLEDLQKLEIPGWKYG